MQKVRCSHTQKYIYKSDPSKKSSKSLKPKILCNFTFYQIGHLITTEITFQLFDNNKIWFQGKMVGGHMQIKYL